MINLIYYCTQDGGTLFRNRAQDLLIYLHM